MRRPAFQLIITAGVLLTGCLGGPGGAPLRYVALDPPTAIPTSAKTGHLARVTRTRIEFFGYRPPQDIRSMLGELQQQCGGGVLRNVDVHLEIPICLVPFCGPKDSATAECGE